MDRRGLGQCPDHSGTFSRRLGVGSATAESRGGRPQPAINCFPGSGDDSLVQSPDGGGWGDRWDTVAGANRTDTSGAYPDPCRLKTVGLIQGRDTMGAEPKAGRGIRSPFSQCPFQIRMCDSAGVIATATGFFYELDGETFLITNWHNIAGKHFSTRGKCKTNLNGISVVGFPIYDVLILAGLVVIGVMVRVVDYRTQQRLQDIERKLE